MKMDIRGYFMHIDRERLASLVPRVRAFLVTIGLASHDGKLSRIKNSKLS